MTYSIDPLPNLAVHQMHGSKWWLTLYDYGLFLRTDSTLYQITVPAGYRYDRSSIPWEGIISKDSLGCVAPLIHDALYQCAGHPASFAYFSRVGCSYDQSFMVRCEPERTFTRAEADELFRVVMLTDGVKSWRATVAYWAVRLFAGRW